MAPRETLLRGCSGPPDEEAVGSVHLVRLDDCRELAPHPLVDDTRAASLRIEERELEGAG